MLTEFYGSAFVSQYGEEPTATWAHVLIDLTPQDYIKGMELLKHRDSSFPPNPGEFLEMIGNDSGWERQCHKVFTPVNKLEDLSAKEANKKAGQEFFAGLSF